MKAGTWYFTILAVSCVFLAGYLILEKAMGISLFQGVAGYVVFNTLTNLAVSAETKLKGEAHENDL